MESAGLLHDLLFDYTLRTVSLGSAVLGLVSGVLGAFAVLRRQSLVGDAVSHAALPGVALAFLITGSKAPEVLLLGALAAGWFGTLLVLAVVNLSRLKIDAALGLVLSVFFGFGLVLLTYIQKRPDATQAGLETYLFGQAAALLTRDVALMAGLGLTALVLVAVFWKEFKLVTFDPEYGASLGFPMRWLDIILTTLLVVAIVLGLKTVGVVLMSAMVIAPAAAARQWTDRLGVMVLLSGLFGAGAGVAGAVISSTSTRMPTGPTIVLCISAFVVFSFAFAPNRGLLWRWWRSERNRRRLVVESVLGDLYELSLQHASQEYAHSPKVLKAMNVHRAGTGRALKNLEARGWARPESEYNWALTPAGIVEAERLFREQAGGEP